MKGVGIGWDLEQEHNFLWSGDGGHSWGKRISVGKGLDGGRSVGVESGHHSSREQCRLGKEVIWPGERSGVRVRGSHLAR